MIPYQRTLEIKVGLFLLAVLLCLAAVVVYLGIKKGSVR